LMGSISPESANRTGALAKSDIYKDLR